ADFGIAAGLAVAGDVADDAGRILRVVFRRIELGLLLRLDGLVGLERVEGQGHLGFLPGAVLLEVALLAGSRAHVLRLLRPRAGRQGVALPGPEPEEARTAKSEEQQSGGSERALRHGLSFFRTPIRAR